MPATPEELQRVVEDFEQAHHPILRALADLRVRGSMVLDDHGLFGSRIEDQFDDFILEALRENDLSTESFEATLRDLYSMQETIEELDRLP